MLLFVYTSHVTYRRNLLVRLDDNMPLGIEPW